MSFLDSVMGAVRKFSPKKSDLGTVKQSMESQPIRLPSEEVLKTYESRYEDKMPPRTPADVLRDPQVPPVPERYRPQPSPISSQYPFNAPYAEQQNTQSGSTIPKIDLILAEIEAVKAQLKVLSEKLDILESHYRT